MFKADLPDYSAFRRALCAASREDQGAAVARLLERPPYAAATAARAGHIHRRLRVGNTCVNRNQVGAVVGVQPFGGQGLSGTGPKTGGPHYLHRFASERTLTVNTTAAGGNTALVSLEEEP